LPDVALAKAEFKVQGSKFKVQGSKFKVQGSRFKVQSSGFKVQGSGFGCRLLTPIKLEYFQKEKQKVGSGS
jgi:hypothetical protein